MKSDDDKALFAKLKASSLLDLALCVPLRYSDRHLSQTLEVGKVHTLEIEVQETHLRNSRWVVRCWLPQFETHLQAIFFRPTPYHLNAFKPHATHIIQGKLETYNAFLQISQPKVINNPSTVIPSYKSELRANEIRYLIEKYVTYEALTDEGLEPIHANRLLSLHFPSSLDGIVEERGFASPIVETLKYVEAYNHIKKLSKKKRNYTPLRALDGAIEPFVQALPFCLTLEQRQIIAQIRNDLASSTKAARRMIVGDVGSGKTMVILASAMIAGHNGSILMAPTSILAQQIYEEATRYLPTLTIALVMQSIKESQDLAQFDFIIGTHALFYCDNLPQVALIMVDEQHRFGSNQRRLLENMMSQGGRRPHYLQFSATPIPRTQAMINSTFIDVSLITTTPFEKDITTVTISKEHFKKLLVHIQEEIMANHQVLIVYPLVEVSEAIAYQSLQESEEFWRKRFEGVYVTHGKDKNKEGVLLEFREQGKILLATTVIEVGISLPNLTLVVIVGAERLGLATLHQLRGRVGRNGLKSWCYLYSNHLPNKRLEAFAQTFSGFDISRLDLQYRNSGDILEGKNQSGEQFVWLDLANDEEIVAKVQKMLKLS